MLCHARAQPGLRRARRRGSRRACRWSSAAVAIEQFGYGFGFTAYMLFMLMVAGGGRPTRTRPRTTRICTGFMALGMMLPGMAAGWLQEQLGYTSFFIWVCVATLPSFAAAALLKIDPAFGLRRDGDSAAAR